MPIGGPASPRGRRASGISFLRKDLTSARHAASSGESFSRIAFYLSIRVESSTWFRDRIIQQPFTLESMCEEPLRSGDRWPVGLISTYQTSDRARPSRGAGRGRAGG